MHENGSHSRTASDDSTRGLLILNGALLLVLGLITFGGHAYAQQRPRGDYNMVAGGVNGSETGAVYIVDGTTQEMIAITYNASAKEMIGIGYRNLAADAAAGSARDTRR